MISSFREFYQKFITEDSIDHFEFIDSPHKTKPFSKADLKYIKNPGTVEHLKNVFKNYKFNIFLMEDKLFHNYPGGAVLLPKMILDKSLNLDASKKIIRQITNDSITCIFVGNEADNPMPITPWQQAHRIGHVISMWHENYKAETYFVLAQEIIQPLLTTILYKQYPEFKDLRMQDMYFQLFANTFSEYDRITYPILYQLGTFKSARSKTVRNLHEFINELIAQFLVTGTIKFNTLDDKIYESDIKDCELAANEILTEMFDSLKGKTIYVSFD